MKLPPFTNLVRLEYRHLDSYEAEAAAVKMGALIDSRISSEDRLATEVIGPAPCFFARLAGMYRWQVIVRGPDPLSLLRGRSFHGWRLEVNPPSLL